MYKNGNYVEIKTGGSLNKPYCEYEYSSDYSSSSATVNIYTNESSNKKELLSKDEIKTIGTDNITELDYTGDFLYFAVVEVDENDSYIQSFIYYKKDLKTNKLEKIQEILRHDF